ncbi:hypothetical protein [Sorangium sp. So ce406]|uniref:hypothetical protein n=1 Tax=Sorangium sp. So ce406 TaxID=3133311 RepID=UPI003F5B85D3
MPSPPIGCRELDLLVHEALHVHNEHARATSESVRRKLHARLLELEERFERVLTESVSDEAVRRAWREHLHARGPAPAEPPPPPILVFRGRSEAGSEVVVRVASSGELRVEVDGALLNRTVALALRQDGERSFFPIKGVGDFGETFVASPEAIEALRAWVDEPRGQPPWEHLRELADDGLVGKDFALTPRGRRALGRTAA